MPTASDPSLIEAFLVVSRLASRQVASLGLRMQGRVDNIGKAGGGTPTGDALSAVDLIAQDIFLEALHQLGPEVAVDAEEDTQTVDLFAPAAPDRPLVVLDPIDGTFSYLSGSEDWAVMAGLIEGSYFQAAHIYYPAWDISIEATRGGSTILARGRSPGQKVTLGPEYASTGRLLVGSHFVLEGAPDFGLELERCRCSAVEGCAPLLGRADGALTNHPVDRRHTIPLFASWVAGGSVRFGSRWWQGEDPKAERFEGPTALAPAQADAERWMGQMTVP